MICKLALEDGTIFTGQSIGASGTRVGEVVFNTSHTGYQEIITDPSYCGQIVTLTFPLIGNYGINREDVESRRPFLSGLVVREVPPRPSNFRATAALEELLREADVLGIAGVDTRALTRRIRIHGCLRGVLSTEILDERELLRKARGADSMVGANLVAEVSPISQSEWTQGLWTPPDARDGARAFDHCASPGNDRGGSAADAGQHRGSAQRNSELPSLTSTEAPHIVVFDCGIKQNMLRHLASLGCRTTVVPSGTPSAQIDELAPDGLLVSNGPGDPAAVTDTIRALRALLGRYPIFGICLGHQMLGLALGAETYKLRFGHHGANVPVQNRISDRVEITSQNHGFAVEARSLERIGGQATHINLNDDSLEGYIHEDRRVMAVQFHPEASPGPHDSNYLFSCFVAAVRSGGTIKPEMLAGAAGTKAHAG